MNIIEKLFGAFEHAEKKAEETEPEHASKLKVYVKETAKKEIVFSGRTLSGLMEVGVFS